MNTKLGRKGLAIVFSAAAIFGLTACGDADENTGSDQNQSQDAGDGAETDAEESQEFIDDMTEGVDIVLGQLEEEPDMTQIMLASDVDKPTQKYGMWVMPYYPSDAVEEYMSTIQVEDGNFHVTATSAETGQQWEMDQDGNMTEAADEE